MGRLELGLLVDPFVEDEDSFVVAEDSLVSHFQVDSVRPLDEDSETVVGRTFAAAAFASLVVGIIGTCWAVAGEKDYSASAFQVKAAGFDLKELWEWEHWTQDSVGVAS